MRVPGVGIKSAQRIVRSRRNGSISYYDLKKFGTVLKRARYFITCQGKYFGGIPIRDDLLRNRLTTNIAEKNQLSLFEQANDNWSNAEQKADNYLEDIPLLTGGSS